MRGIKYIVLHCTATSQRTTVASILKYWRNFLGWQNPGYHFIIKADGEVVQLHPIEKVANGVRGFNSVAIHIAYMGGVDRNQKPLDNRTPEQRFQQMRLVKELKRKFPTAEIKGHRDFPGVIKACPSFDVAQWLKEVCICP